MPQPGILDQQIVVQEEAGTPDGAGGSAPAWSPLGTIWAAIEPIRGQARVIADQQAGVQGYRLVVRNNGVGAAITTKHRLLWGADALNVRSAPRVGRDLYRTIEAVAKVAT